MSNLKLNDATSLYEMLKGMLLNITVTAPAIRHAQTTTHSRNTLGPLSTKKTAAAYAYLGNCDSRASNALPADISEMLTPLPDCSPESLIDCIAALTPEPELLLVDIDALGDTTEAVDILTRLRLSQPQIVLIILSGYFLVDDIDQHRISICDAALRLPVTRKRFETALDFAHDTNKVWQSRAAHSKRSAIRHTDTQKTLSFQS